MEDQNKSEGMEEPYIPSFVGEKKQDAMSRLHQRAEEAKKRIPIQLPMWPENRRGMPNTFLRSALFTCRRHNDEREHYDNVKLATTSDFELFYTGRELSQEDEDLFLEIVHRTRHFPLGEPVSFSGYELLKSLGWGSSSRDYKRLQDGIHRLKIGTLKIVMKEVKGYAGSLIRKYTFDEADADGKIRYKVWLEPELVHEFREDGYTQLKQSQRFQLGKAGLAKWLHSYYSTHQDPYGLKTDTIRTLCSSDTKTLARFRHQCKEAHDRLVSVGFLQKWEYDPRNDIFSVDRA